MMRREAVGIVIAILVAASLSVGYLAGIASRSTSVGASTLTSQQTTLSIFSTTVTAQDAYLEGEVANAYATHVAQLSSRDISALPGDYESNATVEWIGGYPGLSQIGAYPGTYSGARNISILWGGTIGKFINFSVSDEHQSIGIKGDVSLVNSTLDFRGWTYCITNFGSMGGIVNGSVAAQDVYEHVSNSSPWFITSEIWNFTPFNVQCSQVTSRSSSTSASTTLQSSTSTSLTSSLPTCYETLDTVLNPAPEGTVYMKVVTDQGAVITNGTLFVTQAGMVGGESLQAGYCIRLGDINGTGYLQLAANATFITSGYYNVTLMAGYDQGPWYTATIP
jgi:hypothetical protein